MKYVKPVDQMNKWHLHQDNVKTLPFMPAACKKTNPKSLKKTADDETTEQLWLRKKQPRTKINQKTNTPVAKISVHHSNYHELFYNFRISTQSPLNRITRSYNNNCTSEYCKKNIQSRFNRRIIIINITVAI